jgi:hypothetical protein
MPKQSSKNIRQANFSERLFEFYFNYEFVYKTRFNGYDIETIDIPTQTDETNKGYDFLIKLRSNGAIIKKAIIMQYKRPEYVIKAIKNPTKSIFIEHKGKFFRFKLDRHQHNLLKRLSSSNTHLVAYCAPLTVDRKELANYFYNRTIFNNSQLCFLKYTGSIKQRDKPHKITFDKSKYWKFRSENDGQLTHGVTMEEIIRLSGEKPYLLSDLQSLYNEILQILKAESSYYNDEDDAHYEIQLNDKTDNYFDLSEVENLIFTIDDLLYEHFNGAKLFLIP